MLKDIIWVSLRYTSWDSMEWYI